MASVMLADEIVELKGYGSARQLTLFEAGKAILQVLTSDLTATGASLLCWLRARYAADNSRGWRRAREKGSEIGFRAKAQ